MKWFCSKWIHFFEVTAVTWDWNLGYHRCHGLWNLFQLRALSNETEEPICLGTCWYFSNPGATASCPAIAAGVWIIKTQALAILCRSSFDSQVWFTRGAGWTSDFIWPPKDRFLVNFWLYEKQLFPTFQDLEMSCSTHCSGKWPSSELFWDDFFLVYFYFRILSRTFFFITISESEIFMEKTSPFVTFFPAT